MYTHSAPILTRADICKCLSEMGVSVTEQQLTKPNTETVSRVYRQFAELLAGFNATDAAQPRFAANDIMEYPELHEDSIPQMAFQMALMRLMYAVGISDFSMRDVTHPSERRVREHMSAVINFAKFRETCLAKYEAVTQRTEDLAERKQRCDEEHAELSAVLRKLSAQIERDAPEVERLKAEAASRTEELSRLNNEQASLSSSIHALKETGKALVDDANDTKFELHSVQQECVRLRSQIVQSPERLRETLEGLSARADAERTAVKDAEHRSFDLRAKADALGRVEKDVTRVIGAMEDCARERDEKKKCKAARVAAEDKCAQAERRLRELDAGEQALEAKVAGVKERHGRLEKQNALKENAARQALVAARAEAESLKRSSEHAASKVAKENNAAAGIRRDIEELERNHHAEVEAIRAQFDRVEKQVAAYHESVFSSLEGTQVETPAKA